MEAEMDLPSETALEDSSQEKCPEAREITLGRMDLESAFAESASTEKLSVIEEAAAPTQISSEMEAGKEGPFLGEDSSQKDWENLFEMCPEAREIILYSLDLESALACRLVCKEWRKAVNYYRKLWTKINKVCSIAINVFILRCQD